MKALDQKKDVVIKSEMTGNELLAIANEEIPSLLDPILAKVGIASIVGSSDTGKSSFLRQLVLAVVQDDDSFLDFDLNCEHNRAIYVSTEDEQNATAHCLARQLGLLEEIEQGEKPTVEGLDRLTFLFDTADLHSTLKGKLEEDPVDIIIVDAFSDVYGGSLNTSNKVRTFIQNYVDLAREHQCLVLFLHHNGKRTQHKNPHKDNILGSQGYEGKMRAVVEIRDSKKGEEYRNLLILKHNYLSASSKEKVYELTFGEDLNFEFTGKEVGQAKSLTGSKPSKVDILLDNHSDLLDKLLDEANSFSFDQAINKLEDEGVSVSKGTLHKAKVRRSKTK